VELCAIRAAAGVCGRTARLLMSEGTWPTSEHQHKAVSRKMRVVGTIMLALAAARAVCTVSSHYSATPCTLWLHYSAICLKLGPD